MGYKKSFASDSAPIKKVQVMMRTTLYVLVGR